MSYHSNILQDGRAIDPVVVPLVAAAAVAPSHPPDMVTSTTLTIAAVPTTSTVATTTATAAATPSPTIHPQPTHQPPPQTPTPPLDSLQQQQQPPISPVVLNMFAAGCGSLTTGLTMTPLDVLGKRIQAEKLVNPTGSTATLHATLRAIIQREGPSRLWAGLSTALAMAVPNTIIYFSTYEALRSAFVKWVPQYRDYAGASSNPLLNHPLVQAALQSSFLPPFLAGVFSRLFCTTLVAPLELIRTRQQTYLVPAAASGAKSSAAAGAVIDRASVPSFRSIFRDIVYSAPAASRAKAASVPTPTGSTTAISPARFSNLYRGLGTTLWRDVPFSALYWSFNERCKGFLTESNFLCTPSLPSDLATEVILNSKDPKAVQPPTVVPNSPVKSRSAKQTWAISFISGATAGTFASILTHPFEVIKTAQQFRYDSSQLSKHSIDLSRANLVTTCSYITRERGIKGLFVGLLPRTLKIAPSCAVMLSSYDLTKTLLGIKPNLAGSDGNLQSSITRQD